MDNLARFARMRTVGQRGAERQNQQAHSAGERSVVTSEWRHDRLLVSAVTDGRAPVAGAWFQLARPRRGALFQPPRRGVRLASCD